jgi:hypothetical protein
MKLDLKYSSLNGVSIYKNAIHLSLLKISDKYTKSLLKRQCESETGYSGQLTGVGLNIRLNI